MSRYSPPLLITRVITLLVAFTIHEFSHALTATWLGDDLPRREGRLSLNPIRHLDFWGSVLLLTVGYGWAKPVKVNRYAVQRKTKAGMMLVSLAGPLSNLLLALIAGFFLRYQLFLPLRQLPQWMPTPSYFLSEFIWTNISLAVFNMLPVAPLDGEKVVEYFIPRSAKAGWYNIQRYGRRILMLIFFVLPYLNINIVGNFIGNVTYSLYRVIIGG